jgi:hypothetical protein
MLSRIKMTYPEIRAALMEILDEKLSIENLKAIKQYVPTGDEIELIKDFDGDFETLGHAEKFYREVSVTSAIECLLCFHKKGSNTEKGHSLALLSRTFVFVCG